ncbi:MAG: hypothetical protein P8046_10780 [Anaerolineales bacterium]
MNVVILAGGELSPEDPLYPLIPENTLKKKVFLPLEGKPMLQWVLDALAASQHIDKMVLVGVDESSGFQAGKSLVFIPDHGSLVENIIAGVRYSREPEMVDWVVENGEIDGVDLLYNVITDKTMESRFPGSNRTFAPLKGIRVCGGDLNIISNRLIDDHIELWQELTAARKNVLKQAAIFGPRLLFALLFRWYDLNQVAEYLSRRLGLKAKAVVSPYAELGMDVDKPHQYELIAANMAEQAIGQE